MLGTVMVADDDGSCTNLKYSARYVNNTQVKMPIAIGGFHKVQELGTEHPGEARDILWVREPWGLLRRSQCSLGQAQRHAPGYKTP